MVSKKKTMLEQKTWKKKCLEKALRNKKTVGADRSESVTKRGRYLKNW